MARISQIFGLNKKQSELDFLDIDTSKDVPLFIDPHFLSNRNDPWSQASMKCIQSFFEYLLLLIKSKNIDEARNIFEHLKEPNETCLGLSKGAPRGRSINSTDINKLFKNLVKSKAVASGLVEHLEDTMIFVNGIGKDKLSDMTTAIIREKLIQYTQQQCGVWNIPLTQGVQSGMYWSPKNTRWEHRLTDCLVIDGEKRLLVPKSIISFCDSYTPSVYHQHFVLNFLQNENLRLKTSLVKYRTNKSKRTKTAYVSKDELKEKVSSGDKQDLNTFTLKHPKVFQDFKKSKSGKLPSLANHQISSVTTPSDKSSIAEIADYLGRQLALVQAGKEDADKYEDVIMSILELLFYPDLTCPAKQVKIHNGRKRIDITFENAAYSGFFLDLHTIHKTPSSYIMVECKNYKNDPANPELDQLSGRFSPNRGRCGLLIFRRTSDMNAIIEKCKDTLKDDRGLIIPICDDDLITGIINLKTTKHPLEKILKERARKIRMG